MKKIFITLILVTLVFPFNQVLAATPLAKHLSGRILLAVGQGGEAWYVNPSDLKRYSLANTPETIKEVGIGITDKNLARIPAASAKAKSISASDKKFINRVKGRIFIQVQDQGQAWYVNPSDGRRYSLGSNADVRSLVAKFGLGISNVNLSQIVIANSSLAPVIKNTATPAIPYDLSYLTQKINSLVNAERVKAGLTPLLWNDAVAAVAEQHSQDLAKENLAITGLNKACDYFLIHHEGFTFGFYQDDRLKSSGIEYFSASGENIAMQGGKNIEFQSSEIVADQNAIESCIAKVEMANNDLKTQLESDISTAEKTNLIMTELSQRKLEYAAEAPVDIVNISYSSNDEMASEIVLGWMNSPGHRANILNPEYDEAGIGLAYVNGYIIATQDFITRSNCGFKGAPCCPSYSCFVPNMCEINSGICE